ncbi:hypothetical protein [Megalodesulfovibrio gigas]|nr:hypothetical protein [Megalodesulfovibrio gigas]
MAFDISTFMKQRAQRAGIAGSTPVKKWISLPRNGQKTLDFMGELVATITERNAVHSGASEWKLSIFRALPDHYVFASALRLAAPERMTLYSARVFETQQALRAFLLDGQHAQVELPRLLLEKAGMLRPGTNAEDRLRQGRAFGPQRLQWGDGWASVWQLLAHGGFNYATSTRVPQ